MRVPAHFSLSLNTRYWKARQHGWNMREEGLQQGDHAPFVLYTSEQGHSSLRVAAELLGIGAGYLRTVPCLHTYQMDVAALRWQIERDKTEGLTPWCIVSSIGSTPTGAIDPIEEIAQVCTAYDLWHHGDAAYGGVGIVVPELHPLYRGRESLDSMTIDPHKMLSVPIGCGTALVRQGALLRETFGLKPSYLAAERGEPWLHEFTFELTRPLRALPVLAVLQTLGRSGVRSLVEHYISLARYLTRQITEHEELELKATGLSIVCFRYAPQFLQKNRAELNTLNATLVTRLQDSGKVFLSRVDLGGECVLRVCICNYLTTEHDIEVLVQMTLVEGRFLEGLYAPQSSCK